MLLYAIHKIYILFANLYFENFITKPFPNTQKLRSTPLWACMCAALSHVLSHSTSNLSISLCQHKLGSIDISDLENNQFYAFMPQALCIGWVRVGLEFRALRDTQRSSLTRMIFYSHYMSARLYFIQRTSRTRSRDSQEKTIHKQIQKQIKTWTKRDLNKQALTPKRSEIHFAAKQYFMFVCFLFSFFPLCFLEQFSLFCLPMLLHNCPTRASNPGSSALSHSLWRTATAFIREQLEHCTFKEHSEERHGSCENEGNMSHGISQFISIRNKNVPGAK